MAVKEQGQASSAGSRFCLDCGVCPGWLCCQAEQAWRRESRPGVAGAEAEDQTEAGAGAEVDWVWWCGYFWYQLIPRWIRHLKQNSEKYRLHLQRKRVSAETWRLRCCWTQNQDLAEGRGGWRNRWMGAEFEARSHRNLVQRYLK